VEKAIQSFISLAFPLGVALKAWDKLQGASEIYPFFSITSPFAV